MIYGATTMYGKSHPANYAALATYLRVDIHGQRTRPAGHAVNPTPITEAERIPDIDEIIDVHLFANRLVELEETRHAIYRDDETEVVTEKIVTGGRLFNDDVLAGFLAAGIDIQNPFEMLLGIRRVGSKRLEELFGPGRPTPGRLLGRTPVARSHSIEQLEETGEGLVAALDERVRERIRKAEFRACIATTDVHEYGKILIETVLRHLGVTVIDGGTSTDPNDLAVQVRGANADFVALSSYNGVALNFVSELKNELRRLAIAAPIFVGGRLNRIPDGSNTSLPVDVSTELATVGAIVCPRIEAMLDRITEMATERLSTDPEPRSKA
jgi:methylmalonyl-CoA mutase cobalamin-binding subunit